MMWQYAAPVFLEAGIILAVAWLALLYVRRKRR